MSLNKPSTFNKLGKILALTAALNLSPVLDIGKQVNGQIGTVLAGTEDGAEKPDIGKFIQEKLNLIENTEGITAEQIKVYIDEVKKYVIKYANTSGLTTAQKQKLLIDFFKRAGEAQRKAETVERQAKKESGGSAPLVAPLKEQSKPDLQNQPVSRLPGQEKFEKSQITKPTTVLNQQSQPLTSNNKPVEKQPEPVKMPPSTVPSGTVDMADLSDDDDKTLSKKQVPKPQSSLTQEIPLQDKKDASLSNKPKESSKGLDSLSETSTLQPRNGSTQNPSTVNTEEIVRQAQERIRNSKPLELPEKEVILPRVGSVHHVDRCEKPDIKKIVEENYIGALKSVYRKLLKNMPNLTVKIDLEANFVQGRDGKAHLNITSWKFNASQPLNQEQQEMFKGALDEFVFPPACLDVKKVIYPFTFTPAF